MAMDGNQNRRDGAPDASQNFRSATTRRVDPSRGQPNVPVLFRLKNLQRTNPDEAVERTPAQENSVPMTNDRPRGSRPNSNRESDLSNRPSRDTLQDLTAKSSGANAAAAPSTTQNAAADPAAAPGKHGISNGFILLVVGILIAFAMGRNSNRSSEVAVNPAKSSLPPSKAAAAEIMTPLAPPELPTLAIAELSQSIEETLTGSLPSNENAKSSDDLWMPPNQQTIVFNSSEKNTDAKSNTLPVPSILVASNSETSLDALLKSGNDDRSKNEDMSLPISSVESSQVSTSFKDAKHSSQSSDTDGALSSDANSFDPHPKVAETSVPNMDTAQLYQIFANYQSQREALARARQVQTEPPLTTPAANPSLQVVSAQTTYPGQPVQPNMATPNEGYGVNQAYNAGQLNASYGGAPTSTMYAPTQSSNYVPIGAQLSYPPSFQSPAPQGYQPPQAYQPPLGYQPVFAPPHDPSQAAGMNSFPQSASPQNPNFAPPYQSN